MTEFPMDSEPSERPAWYRNRQRSVQFDEEEFARFLDRISRDLAHRKPFAVMVAGDGSVRRANGQFRGRRASTDVLSFPDGENGRLGDILISAARAQRQALRHGHRVDDELKILVLHGLLHLLGYDHERDDGRMRRAERRWRRKYGLGEGLIERTAGLT